MNEQFFLIFLSLKGALKMRERKIRHDNAGMENAGVEFAVGHVCVCVQHLNDTRIKTCLQRYDHGHRRVRSRRQLRGVYSCGVEGSTHCTGTLVPQPFLWSMC